MNPSNPRLFIASAAAALLPAKARTQTGPAMRLRCRCADQEFSYLLRGNATSRDLISRLPLELSIEDFPTNAKRAHLPRRLDETGGQPIRDEAPSDLCYFRGWGNLAFFHSGFPCRDDLNLPGRIEGGVAPLRVRSLHPLRPDHMS